MDSYMTEVLTPYIPSDDFIEQLMLKTYGLRVTQLKPLNGYDDKNYHVTAESGHSNPYIDAGNEFFLKVVNKYDSSKPEMMHAQMAVMDYLNEHGIPSQRTLKDLNGEYFPKCTVVKDGEEETYLVCLRTYIQGVILNEVTITRPLLYNLGLFVGKMSIALKDFHHPFYDDFDCLWSMSNVPKVKEVVSAVKDKVHRAVVDEVLKMFDEEVLPRKKEFITCQIHGDVNEQNILVTEETDPKAVPQVCGIIDFQDSMFSHPVYDLALLIAYVLTMPAPEVRVEDVPGHILAGYVSVRQLPDVERDSLRTLVAARLVQSLVYGAYKFELDPSNDYVMTTSKEGWKSLVTFWSTPKEKIEKNWEEITSSYRQ